MKRTGIIMLTLALLLPLGCKNKERGLERVDELPTPRTERGPDLGLPIRIIDTPVDNWVTIDTLNNENAKQMSIGNVYLSRVSRAMFRSQFGFLIEGDLPDGCSFLHSVELRFDGDTVTVVVRSRRDPSAMCTQALVPFSYFAPVEDDNAFTAAKRWKSGDTTANID
jgi:hypothetical protein